MTPAYNAKSKKCYDKYYNIGYSAYYSSVPRDIADDLSFGDRASFLRGWDDAKNNSQSKVHPTVGAARFKQ